MAARQEQTMQYMAIIELDELPTQGRSEALLDALAGYHPAVSVSDYGLTEVVVSVPAESLRQACTTALAVVEQAAQRSARTVHVLAATEFDERAGVPALPDVVGVTEAASILKVSRQAVLELVERGRLPHARAGHAVVIPRAAVLQRAMAQTAPGGRG